MKKRSLKKLLITSVVVIISMLGLKATQVDAANQGPYIKDGSIVQITKNNYEIWQNFDWKLKNNTNNVYNKTFEARGRYQHKNGSTYYSLFDNKGNWQGYLNAKATTKTPKQGRYISDGRYVKVNKPNYEMWQNFSWTYKNNSTNFVGQTLQARGRYQHFNGSTYYSLYDNKGTWQGYLNAGATQNTKAEGDYISDGRYVKITKKNYDIWQNFSWKKRSNSTNYYGQNLQAKGRYQHFNGSTYYSLFDSKGDWVGYLNEGATENYKPENKDVHKTINQDANGKVLSSTNDYEFVSETTTKSVTKSANGDTVTTHTTIKVWKKKEVNPIIASIVNQDVSKKLEKQVVTDDIGISIQQAEKVTNQELNDMVADRFTKKVNEERKKHGPNQISITKDNKAKQELAGRPVEVMYYFEHAKPSGMRPGEDYWLEREPGEPEMAFFTENISKTTASKHEVNGNPERLADIIAEAMFNQYIDGERDAAINGGPGNPGHYKNIILTNFSDIISAVYVVDFGSYYSFTTVVCTGDVY